MNVTGSYGSTAPPDTGPGKERVQALIGDAMRRLRLDVSEDRDAG